jgi:diguanylate cyclase (GGDEF)-like protein
MVEFNNPNLFNPEKKSTFKAWSSATDEIYKKMYVDTLTGFENRRGLNNYKNSLEPEAYPLIMFTADLDNLKLINDNTDPDIGTHTNGDKYILSFVKFANEIFPDIKKFRLGGDEFAIPILNTDPKELDSIYQKLEDFNKKITKEESPNSLKFTYAFDIASSKEDFYDSLKRADYKLVKAKDIKKAQKY